MMARYNSKSSAMLIVVAMLSRLVVTSSAGPAPLLSSHSAGVNDEQQIERLYELLDSYHQKRSAAAAGPPSTRRDTRPDTDTDTDGEAHTEAVPKFHYEVHHVTHKFGHRTRADEKLRDVARHAAAGSSSDDDEDEEEEDETSPPAAGAGAGAEGVDDTQLGLGPLISPGADDFYDLSADDYKRKQQQQPMMSDDDDDHNDDVSEWTNKRQDDFDVDDQEAGVKSLGHVASRQSSSNARSSISDVYFVAVVVGCSVAGLAGLMVAGVCWYRLHKKMKATSEVSYPAYGVTGPAGSPPGKDGSPGDRKLAQSAQMYHYQHQKQQMIASERVSQEHTSAHVDAGSDVESDDDNVDGDYTVFECRGLATNGEMEVRNPLFNDQQTTSTDSSATPTAAKK